MHSATDSTFGAQLIRQDSFALNTANVADIATVIVLRVEAFLCEGTGNRICYWTTTYPDLEARGVTRSRSH